MFKSVKLTKESRLVLMLSILFPATQSYFRFTRLSSLSKVSILLSQIHSVYNEIRFYRPWMTLIELWDR